MSLPTQPLFPGACQGSGNFLLINGYFGCPAKTRCRGEWIFWCVVLLLFWIWGVQKVRWTIFKKGSASVRHTRCPQRPEPLLKSAHAPFECPKSYALLPRHLRQLASPSKISIEKVSAALEPAGKVLNVVATHGQKQVPLRKDVIFYYFRNCGL